MTGKKTREAEGWKGEGSKEGEEGCERKEKVASQRVRGVISYFLDNEIKIAK